MKTEEEKLQARLDKSIMRLQKLRSSKRDVLDHMISNPPIGYEVKKSLVRSSRQELKSYLENRKVQKLRRESVVTRNQLQKLLSQTPGRKDKVQTCSSPHRQEANSSQFSHRFLSDTLTLQSERSERALSSRSSGSTSPLHRAATYEIIADGAGNVHMLAIGGVVYVRYAMCSSFQK
ncbi:hypothetical protein GUITHDRAFT_148587 [Guillardia theta CCMP2712]|uniref:Uncharacterized protein n=1 Tax=Guillardia theta (strain CCMP2712) TaxID=905079 RepID=L1I9C5_GUITC|nr:hypothetical protein GUITHDRAFT_148587 [Guillardia theta CCMP2712]EKX32509.1 hypothetical protein GUITHDRAFT_148587 [Guillardia theta CCMP2712]|eukprot:XP_005819489.1 hypothetical protein GUITHDRAFT_148587 [Guillardia theta CCMP2712]